MKTTNTKSFLLLAIFMLSIHTYAQEGEWGDPISITDNESFNKNANTVSTVYGLMMFWEKSSDENSTAIYMRNLTNMGSPIAVLEQENVHYRNVQIIKLSTYPNPPDTLFYLFYESDIEGSFNIYYQKYSQDGSFSPPENLGISYSDCHHMRISEKNIVWEEANSIFFCELLGNTNNYYFSEILSIDEGDCKNPVVGFQEIAYEKIINEQSHIYTCSYDYQNGEWQTPEELYTIGNNTHLSIITEMESMDHSLLWESYQDGEWRMYNHYYYWQTDSANFQEPTSFNPHALSFPILLKNTQNFDYAYTTYEFNDNNNKDIYVTEFLSSLSSAFNISNSPEEDKHPQLFLDYRDYRHYSYLIWESVRNNHLQLFMSEIYIIMNLEENEASNELLELSPNPCSENLQINLSTNNVKDSKLIIYGLQGQIVKTITPQDFQKQGTVSYNWDLKNEKGNRVSPGIYFISLLNKDQSITKKIVLQ